MVPGSQAYPIHDLRFERSHFNLGGNGGRARTAPRAAESSGYEPSLLRFMDSRRKIFRFSSAREQHLSYLGAPGTSWALRLVELRPSAPHLWPFELSGPLLSRDGKRLFVRTENPKAELVRLDSLSGPYAPIATGISPRTAAFSRDRVWLAFGSLTDNNLWRCRADGTDCRRLTSGFQQCAMPSWSPDGRRIAFMARRFGENWRVFSVSPDGDALEEIPLQGESNGDPDWSPSGNELIFGNVLDASAKMTIYRYDFRTRVVVPLPNSAGMFSPRWSPDGKSVAAVHIDGRRLFLFQFSSGTWKPLTTIPGGYPNWSHDSKWVYFSGRRVVYRTDVRSGVTTPVASLNGIQQGPWILGSWIGLAPDDCPLAIRNETTEKIYAWDFEGR